MDMRCGRSKGRYVSSQGGAQGSDAIYISPRPTPLPEAKKEDCYFLKLLPPHMVSTPCIQIDKDKGLKGHHSKLRQH